MFKRSDKKSGKKKTARKFQIISQSAPFQYQEAFKSLRTNLKFVSVNGDYKKIIFTSAIPGDGKSSVAINLAISMAEAGSRVLLVDADLRKPILHQYLRIAKSTSQGLTGVLAGNCSAEEAVVKFSDLGIHVLVAGAIPPNPAELLGSRKMGELIDSLSQQYDFILFDTPPVSVVTDAAVLSQYADGVILVVRQNHASIDQAKQAQKNLEAVHATIIGAVLNDYDIKNANKETGYYYTYYYDYSSKNKN